MDMKGSHRSIYLQFKIKHILMKVENYMSESKRHIGTSSLVEFEEQLVFGVQCFGKKQKLFFSNQTEMVLALTPEHYSLLCLIDQAENTMQVYNLYECQLYGQNYEDQDFAYQITIKENRFKSCLIFKNQQERDSLLQKLLQLQDHLKDETDQHERFRSSFLKYFVEYNTDQDMHLEKKQINNMINGLNIPEKIAVARLKAIPQFKQKHILSISSFNQFMMLLQCNEDLYPLFSKYAQINEEEQSKKPLPEKYLQPKMTSKDFVQFQKQQQGQVYFKFPQNKDKISFYEFCSFLTSNKHNFFFKEEKLDTSHSLTHYYVHSSHNTYLIGNQLTSDSKAELYYYNLKNGVRCMELDIHDSSQGPIIKHGFTLTASITFQQAIKEISIFSKKYPNHTPIVLSFENHCGEANQKKMVISLDKYLKNKIYLIPEGRKTNQDYLPTIEELRGKIVIQGTGNIKNLYKDIIFVDSEEKNVLHMLIDHTQNKPKPDPKHNLKGAQQDPQDNIKEVTDKDLCRHFAIVVEPEWQLGDTCWQMANIAQNKIEKMMMNKEIVDKLQKYSQKSLIRVYPFGLRFGSSNFNPLPMMKCGAQLISLNTQNYDINYTALKSHFLLNENCGYQLKNKMLLSGNEAKQNKQKKIKIKFLYINSLVPESMLHNEEKTFLRISFLGSQQDMKLNEFLPFEKQSSSSFHCRSFYVKLQQNKENPQIQVRFKEIEYATVVVDIPKCGATGIPLKILKPGYRCLPLYDIRQSLKIMGRILIHSVIDA